MKLMALPLEVISSLVDQMVVVTASTDLSSGLQLRLINHLFDKEVLRAFYRTELVNFNSDWNVPRCSRMDRRNIIRLLLGRMAGPNKCKNPFVQELQDGIGELMKLEEMAFVKIHSVYLGPGRIKAIWSKEAHRIQVDRPSTLQVVAATVLDSLNLSAVVQLLGPDNPASQYWMHTNESQDRSCSGFNWGLLTAALLGDIDTIKALLKRSSNADSPNPILNVGIRLAASHGNFDAVVALLEANANPTTIGYFKGYFDSSNAFREACMAGHEKIVNLLLEPCYGVERKGLKYEAAVMYAARGRRDENHGNVEILKLLLTKGSFANLRKLQRDILGEACFWGREDVLRFVLQDFASVRFHWRGWQTPLDVAIAHKHENIVQILLAHQASEVIYQAVSRPKQISQQLSGNHLSFTSLGILESC